MKLKFTQAKKARRASAFHKAGNEKATSQKRHFLRAKPLPKTFGEQIVRIQRIFHKKDQFGNPIYKMVPHSAQAPKV